jgi:hypothetical protein
MSDRDDGAVDVAFQAFLTLDILGNEQFAAHYRYLLERQPTLWLLPLVGIKLQDSH